MKNVGGKGSMAALIALKVVCCGGLLLATGVFSLGGLLSLVDHPAVKSGGVVLLVLTVVWLLRRSLANKSPSPKSGGSHDEHRRDIA